ncbi:hypothetical protein BGW42_003482 [Actinomortierella wolfii]|nr:hypothetical protein BGW42_003482 [Actinomortierella wolfii]
MNAPVFTAVSRLANYLPLGSYVIYTALQTYALSLGPAPTPATVVVAIPGGTNYSCYYMPGAGVALTYLSCTDDQEIALKISLAIGFFLAVFLSFLKHVPIDGSGPPRADPVVALPPLPESENMEQIELNDGIGGSAGGVGGGDTQRVGSGIGVAAAATATAGGAHDIVHARSDKKQLQQEYYYNRAQANQRPKYRRGVIYVEGNSYYLDFGDFHVWGHAFLSVVAFGTLALCSASVSQCLFPTVKQWIFVYLQIILLVVCCFIAMFWINDPTLSLGLAIIQDPKTGGNPSSPPPPPPKPNAPTYADGRHDGSYPWQTRPPPASLPTFIPPRTSSKAAVTLAALGATSPTSNLVRKDNMSTDSLGTTSKVATTAVSAKAVVIPSPLSSSTLASPAQGSKGPSNGGQANRPLNMPRSSSFMSEVTAGSSHSALSGYVHHPYEAAEIVAARRVVLNMEAEGGVIAEETGEEGGKEKS